jgi:DNA repair photolyase
LSPGLDFEQKLIAKTNLPVLLRQELSNPRYVPQALAIGTVTDAYQPIERKLGLTRQLLEVLAECGHPFSLVTKGSAIERDLGLLASLA